VNKFNPGDKVLILASPKGNVFNNYKVGEVYTLKEKSYTDKGKFQGWLTELLQRRTERKSKNIRKAN
jgi:hypothetical protein